VHTNDLKTDPDILGNPALRINPRKPLLKHQAFQYLYVFVLLLGFGITYSANSVIHALKFGNFTQYSNMLRKFQKTDLLAIAVFHLRLTVAPLLLSREPTVLKAILNVIPVYIVGGYYLAFFFIISHNFEGVHFFDKDAESKSAGSFLYAQASSSCNVAGSWLCFINGGLNYQIEHHLFPRIQHSHYPKIAPIVREFCKMKGIPYVHFPTIWDNMHSTCMHLLTMGTKEDPIKLG
jgi:fatty acid desaturase (delta-4 desaturase)